MLIWMAVTGSVFKACVLAAMCAVPIVPIYWFMARQLGNQCRELERQLAAD
ncbi:MAG TPA: hypothetical protein VGX78_00880 [Pirellulales bacterium]|jgi:hypothetical protein|nr:hypothetical protein [Pirellulales bacterium]